MEPLSQDWLTFNQESGMSGYTIAQPVLQYKGTDPALQVLTYYQIDANGFIVAEYSPTTGNWIGYLDGGPFTMPSDVTNSLSSEDMLNIAASLQAAGTFTANTDYLLIGDEPNPTGEGTLDLSSLISAAQYTQLTQFLTVMPREFLRSWFVANVLPSIPHVIPSSASPGNSYSNDTDVADFTTTASPGQPGMYDDLVWGAFINVFNIANLAYVTANNLEPWAWETQKTEAYYTSQSQPAMASLEASLQQDSDTALSLDPQATAVMQNYLALPPLGDPGLEITRQNAIRELLVQQEYASAQSIVDAYSMAGTGVLSQVLTNPIPYDIVTGAGNTIVATPATSTAST
jgi:hypothetical protein